MRDDRVAHSVFAMFMLGTGGQPKASTREHLDTVREVPATCTVVANVFAVQAPKHRKLLDITSHMCLHQ